MKHSNIPLALLGLLLAITLITARSQERPIPGPAPSYIPAPPPSLAEVSPFPSNTDDPIAVIAHLFDPTRNRLIISIDSQSNQDFVLQKSENLQTWIEEETKQGNKSILTFFVPLQASSQHTFYRVIKK
jgi:hypothetical protein